MRLTELGPRWVGIHNWAPANQAVPSSPRIGITFECPCCKGTDRATRLAIRFDPPIDPQGELQNTTWLFGSGIVGGRHVWARTAGETFDTLTVSPSIDASVDHGHWHGFITNGEIR